MWTCTKLTLRTQYDSDIRLIKTFHVLFFALEHAFTDFENFGLVFRYLFYISFITLFFIARYLFL